MALPKDTYFEFSLIAAALKSRDHAAVDSFFKKAGISSDRLALTAYRSQSRWSFYTRLPGELKKVLGVCRVHRPQGFKVKVRTLGPKDWRDRWQIYFHTMPLGRFFTVVPLWEKKEYRPARTSRIPLYLDPCGAFGSGAHETTRLMIRMMEPLKDQFESFLDIGTGTGILTAAAYHLGARQIEGVDIDPLSTTAARKNFRLNRGKKGVFKTQNIMIRKSERLFQVVAANFISADLLACEKVILKQVAPGGVLLLSGISLSNLEGFLKAFKARGFRRTNLIRGRSWAGLAYRRKS